MRILFSRSFAYAKFRENKTLAKISEFTVYGKQNDIVETAHIKIKALFFLKTCLNHILFTLYVRGKAFLQNEVHLNGHIM